MSSGIPYPEIDPVAIAIGPVSVHWYGIAYLASFVIVWRLALARTGQSWSPLQRNQIEDLIFYGALGVVLGGRVGYALFYQFDRVLENPLWLLKVWEGGMSFHGGLLGVIAALLLYARSLKLSPLQLGDFIAPMVPIGLLLGRLANFIGQELWGRPTEGWWGMHFPLDPIDQLRHPSQLYEAFLEGVLLFALLWWFSRQQRARGLLSGLFLLGYALSRFVVEFAREPDAHLSDALLFDWMTRGQQLSLPMAALGLAFVVYALWFSGDRDSTRKS